MSDQQPLNQKCPWCGEPVHPWESSVTKDGDTYHSDCVAKEEDDAFFDRDMGFGD